MSRSALVLLVAAAGFWAFALRDSVPAGATQPDARTAAVDADLHPHPGADDVVVRRVLAEANGGFAPSPDGNLMSHMAVPDGNLAIRDLRTGEDRVLTENASPEEAGRFAYFSKFSPDGRRIAYQWGDLNAEWALRVVDVETGEITELLPDHETVSYLDIGSWSPDGGTIATVLYLSDGSNRIALVDARDGGHTILRSFDWRSPRGVKFSPDGQWLAYSRRRSGDSMVQDIYLLAVDGSREVPLILSDTNDEVAGWLPGGGPFFYLSGQNGRSRLLAVAVEDGQVASEPRVVRSDLWHIWPNGFSRDAFFYTQMPERRKAYTARFDPDAGELTTPLIPIVPASSMDWASFTTWSAHGDRMAYIADRYLVIRSVATGAERSMAVPFRSVGAWALVWSPTEDRLAVQGPDDQGRSGIHLLDLADGGVERVLRTDVHVSNFQPRWSRDGRSLYVARREAGKPGIGIVLVNLESGGERELYRVERFRGFAVSPDERHLAVGQHGEEGEPDRILLVPLGGGEPRELARIEDARGISVGNACLDWTPDGRHLVVGTNPGPDSKRSLWIVDSDGGQVRELASFVSDGGMQVRPRVHPNGREISVIGGQNRWEVWTIENLSSATLAGGDAARR